MINIKYIIRIYNKREVYLYTLEDENGKLLDVKPEAVIDKIDFINNATVSNSNVVINKDKYATTIVMLSESEINCPSNLIVGWNDLYTFCMKHNCEYLLEELSPEYNPHEISCKTNIRVNWICKECGHTWNTNLPSRTVSRTMCPRCNGGKSTSINEQVIYNAIKKVFTDAINRYKLNSNNQHCELDIYIPSIRTAIDYRGAYYHSSSRSLKNDLIREKMTLLNNIRLIVISETDDLLSEETGDKLLYAYRGDKDKRELIEYISKVLGVVTSVDATDIRKAYTNSLKGNKLNSINNTTYGVEINENLNKKIIPKRYHMRIQFKCPKGHLYETTPDKRARGDGCPYCSGHKVLTGFNDLATLYPRAVEELDSLKSGFTAYEVTPNSHKKAFWICKYCGYEWEHSMLKSRFCRGHISRCPCCKN